MLSLLVEEEGKKKKKEKRTFVVRALCSDHKLHNPCPGKKCSRFYLRSGITHVFPTKSRGKGRSVDGLSVRNERVNLFLARQREGKLRQAGGADRAGRDGWITGEIGKRKEKTTQMMRSVGIGARK